MVINSSILSLIQSRRIKCCVRIMCSNLPRLWLTFGVSQWETFLKVPVSSLNKCQWPAGSSVLQTPIWLINTTSRAIIGVTLHQLHVIPTGAFMTCHVERWTAVSFCLPVQFIFLNMPLQPWCKLLLPCFNTKVRQNIAGFSFVRQMDLESTNSILVWASVCTHLRTGTFFTVPSALGTPGSSSKETPPDSSGVQRCRSALCSDRPQKYTYQSCRGTDRLFPRVKFCFCKSENDNVFPRLVFHSSSKIFSLVSS